MTDAEILASLGPVTFEPSRVVPADNSEVVHHAAPLDDRAREQLREQAIGRLRYDRGAVQARERRIAIARGKVSELRRLA